MTIGRYLGRGPLEKNERVLKEDDASCTKTIKRLQILLDSNLLKYSTERTNLSLSTVTDYNNSSVLVLAP